MAESVVIKGPEGFESWAQNFSRVLKLPAIIALNGELGSGKTTCAKSLAACWGFDPDHVTSPTYNIKAEYRNERLALDHYDLYRVSSLPEELVLEEISERSLILIEWAIKFPQLMQAADYIIELGYAGEGKRHLRVITKGC